MTKREREQVTRIASDLAIFRRLHASHQLTCEALDDRLANLSQDLTALTREVQARP